VNLRLWRRLYGIPNTAMKNISIILNYGLNRRIKGKRGKRTLGYNQRGKRGRFNNFTKSEQ